MLMADIARLAGVSTSTVSRALSGNTLIKADTRERIAELARSMNYQINVGAANLRKRDVQTVSVAVMGHSLQTRHGWAAAAPVVGLQSPPSAACDVGNVLFATRRPARPRQC